MFKYTLVIKLKIVVTGGTGFIGSHLVDKLIEEGHEVKVLGTIRKPHREGINFIKGDIRNLTDLIKAFKDADFVFHLAALSDPNEVYQNPLKAININILATANVLEAAKECKVKRVIFASTVWVYSATKQKEEPNNEKDTFSFELRPHIYASTKLAGELICQTYSKLYNQPFTILRYGIPFGPRIKPNAVVAIFANKAIKGEPITIFGGTQHRPFIYIDDLIKGHIAALQNVAENKIYNLATTEHTIIELANTIKEFFPNLEINIEEKEGRSGDYQGNYVSSELAYKELGWKAELDIKQGIEKFISYLKTQGDS